MVMTNQQQLRELSQCFLHTLSPFPEPRRQAESLLSQASLQLPDYPLAVLHIVMDPTLDDPTRLAASIAFKNHLKAHWAAPDVQYAMIPTAVKQQIKSAIVPLLLSSAAAAPRIQFQLSEALAVIGSHDFPTMWPELLPELAAGLRGAADYAAVNGILSTADTLFDKFRHGFRTNQLLLELKQCLDNFASPLLDVFMKTANLIDSATAAAAPGQQQLFRCQILCCRIFYSLNFQDLPEFFEDHMNEWMSEFRKYLSVTYPLMENNADGIAAVDELRAAVCSCVNLYVEKDEDEKVFLGYLDSFVVGLLGLLGNASCDHHHDRLAVAAIELLTTVSRSVHHSLLAPEGRIPMIFQGIVVPNLRLRVEDEELFMMNYVEYIRRDMEGSDIGTRRRISCELLKGIATNYKQLVSSLVSVGIQNLLNSFDINPAANWMDKDCAMYLVVSLPTDLVDVSEFFVRAILPELERQDVDGFPMLKAGALKFFAMFGDQIPMALQALPGLIRFLGAESNVVHSYAAICIEKLLLAKDEGGRARYTSADIPPVLLFQLMDNLFKALKNPESEENQYIMKCIMRILGFADISGEVTKQWTNKLATALNLACENPKNPVFNHYLFESVAVLVRRACEKNASLISMFELELFPSIEKILDKDVSEFVPYAFQLMALFVELSRLPILPAYIILFDMLLRLDSWERTSNVPALVRFLQAFLQKAPHELNQEGRLRKMLEIFNKLVLAPNTDEQGFYVLNTVIETLDYNVIEPYIRPIWNALFSVPQSRKTVKFRKSMLISMSLFVVKHGSKVLEDTINDVQPNVFQAMLVQFWIPNLKLITGVVETKLTSVASTKLLIESLTLQGSVEHWGKMLDSIVTLLSRPEQDRVEEGPEVPHIPDNVGYSASFVWLCNAGKRKDDPLKDIRDPKEFLVAALSPGRFPQNISQYLESYKCRIV